MKHSHQRRKTVGLLAMACASALAILPAAASDYPTKPIRVILPFAPGGPTDAIGRAIATEMSKSLGQQMVIDSKPGASGTLGAYEVARSNPDGYTLLMNPSVHVIYPAMFKSLRFDPMKDFAPVGVLGTVPMVAVVPASSPYKSLKDLVDHARANPGKVMFASPGMATLPHLVGELLNLTANVSITHVGYKGTGPALTDVMGAHVDMMYAPLAPAMPMIKSGKLRPLAVTPAKRVPNLPDVPTFQEAGIKNFDVVTWYGIWAPKGTPATIVEKLNAEMVKASRTKAVRAVLQQQGTEPSYMNVADFTAFAEGENRKWVKVMKDANIQPE
jgi:tripartite-type tricarboxylate transporter receptor subunit TctC